jgi:hypothetical protein
MNAMDSFALGYLLHRFAYRIGEFFRHWYAKSMKLYWNWVVNQFEELDYTLAWRVTAKNILRPLYGDYSIPGYVIGFIFRVFRLAVGTAVYAVVLALALALYLVWLLIPPFLILRTVIG